MRLPNFLPRQDKFYRLLEQLSSQAFLCAGHLKVFVEGQDEAERTKAADGIDRCKVAAKNALTTVTAELCRSYITPFDREDIQEFSNQLYKITKTMEKVRDRMRLHGLASHHEDFSRQTDLIGQEAAAMNDMVLYLSKGRNEEIEAKAAMLQELELKGDVILGELLVSLFNEGHTTRDLILRKDIYDMLERVIDRYRDAGSVALQIVLKHG